MKDSNKYFKDARKKEINDYLNIVSNYGISYSKIDYKNTLPETHWGYCIENLKIPVEISILKHIRPLGFSNVEIIVDLELESQIIEWENLNDPFTSLSFKSLLKGTNNVTQKIHYLSFHVDRHNGSPTNAAHPLYHLQYLQNAKAKPKDDFDHGDSLQLDAPRMMHFPMELVLGVSFLLSNFSPINYDKLIQNRQYINLCKVYQQRVWRPYINSLDNFWTTNEHQRIWDPKLNCPYLV
ncbi:MAG: hypothetical protein ACYCOO_12010 [Chitinophagaceae bacterium]